MQQNAVVLEYVQRFFVDHFLRAVRLALDVRNLPDVRFGTISFKGIKDANRGLSGWRPHKPEQNNAQQIRLLCFYLSLGKCRISRTSLDVMLRDEISFEISASLCNRNCRSESNSISKTGI